MSPEQAADEIVFATLRAHGALTALLATVPSWGSSIFPEELPEGDSILPAVVFNRGEGRDQSRQGRRYVVAIPYLITAIKAGAAFPHEIANEVDTALHAHTGVVGGYAITIERLGGSVPGRENTEGRKYRSLPSRFLVGLSPSGTS